MNRLHTELMGSVFPGKHLNRFCSMPWPFQNGGGNSQQQQQGNRQGNNAQNPQNQQAQGNNQQKNTQQNNANNQNNAEGNTGDNTNNNIDPNEGLINDIWKETQDDKGQGPNNNGSNAQQQQQQTTQSDPKKDMADYLDGLGLGEFTLSDADKAAIQSGEGLDALVSNINQRIQRAHTSALSNASKLIDARVSAAVDKAVEKSKSFYQGEQLRGVLHEKLPFTKDDVIGPIAETVMRRLMEKGADVTQAIAGTEKFFNRVQTKMDPTYVPPNANTRQGFRQSAVPKAGPSGENESWLSVLSGKS